jgi:hypothetical protein
VPANYPDLAARWPRRLSMCSLMPANSSFCADGQEMDKRCPAPRSEASCLAASSGDRRWSERAYARHEHRKVRPRRALDTPARRGDSVLARGKRTSVGAATPASGSTPTSFATAWRLGARHRRPACRRREVPGLGPRCDSTIWRPCAACRGGARLALAAREKPRAPTTPRAIGRSVWRRELQAAFNGARVGSSV